ncbi:MULTISPECIES: acetyl-CoA carboxylase biotin carboxylase subunit family protein [Mannheimia]|uniref:ATP-grasp domain-containing protein n=1 Tax=Mannheimia pernigra TaxID=111844 RepID=A0A7H8UTD6_9PAST|nr:MULTISPECIES: hypothetical protein [Mannheimia]QLB39647.1 hypothetical protein HV559_01450 [Mannheimia pernigra]QLB41859.1 hypothetical protein HV560_02920 [Mannheimia pernigra]QLB43969.1 hypothetical protein HV561_03925 [Mannheimia pernigra]QTM00913.1 hypothetical protein GM698_04515 [Mannheimia sp. ZY171111]
MKLMIVLQDLVIFRSNWANLVSEDQHILLITSNTGLLSLGSNKPYFNNIIVAEPYLFENISQNLSDFLSTHSYSLDNIRILCNDEYLLPLAARVRDNFNIIGDKLIDILKFTNKITMKEKIADQIKLPKYIQHTSQKYHSLESYLTEIINYLSLPIIAKPTNLAACDGVVKITYKEELEKWLLENKESENYELDEYVDGTLYHIDSIIQDNKVLSVFIGQYSSPVAEFLMGKPNGTILLSYEDKDYLKLIKFNQSVLNAMGNLPNCVTHLEVFINDKGEAIFLEIAARAAGGMIPQMYQKAFNIHIEEIHFKLQMEKDIYIPNSLNSYVAWLWFPKKEGKYLNKSAELLINSDYTTFWDVDEETPQTEVNSIRDRIGGVMIENKDLYQLKKDFYWLCHHYEPYK